MENNIVVFTPTVVAPIVTAPAPLSGASSVALSVATDGSSWQSGVTGSAPLNGVDFRVRLASPLAFVSYYFYCNRSDSETNITTSDHATGSIAAGSSANLYVASNICNYSVPGTYTAKVIATVSGYAAEQRVLVRVAGPDGVVPPPPIVTTPLPPPPTPTPAPIVQNNCPGVGGQVSLGCFDINFPPRGSNRGSSSCSDPGLACFYCPADSNGNPVGGCETTVSTSQVAPFSFANIFEAIQSLFKSIITLFP